MAAMKTINQTIAQLSGLRSKGTLTICTLRAPLLFVLNLVHGFLNDFEDCKSNQNHQNNRNPVSDIPA
jgi:hypothetical protein